MIRQNYMSANGPCIGFQPCIANCRYGIGLSENALSILRADGDMDDRRAIPVIFGRPMNRMMTAWLSLRIGW